MKAHEILPWMVPGYCVYLVMGLWLIRGWMLLGLDPRRVAGPLRSPEPLGVEGREQRPEQATAKAVACGGLWLDGEFGSQLLREVEDPPWEGFACGGCPRRTRACNVDWGRDCREVARPEEQVLIAMTRGFADLRVMRSQTGSIAIPGVRGAPKRLSSTADQTAAERAEIWAHPHGELRDLQPAGPGDEEIVVH